ncbi:hypothetical protein ABE525_23370 [Pseudomonas wadenswilerensis]|uniref:hypothetical protein n=1 Tax=Pseudomonas wadenswilerensis TaxID=1785161 RepID=UPI00142DE6E8|nr:hypothetical protein [Pseudomonas wadenswilerensis]UVM19563.1 hypothetical protein LOY45_13910 [Pseudomonas wadenswilerensis]
MAYKTRVKFIVKESGNGIPSQSGEALDEIPTFPKAPLTFERRPGTSIEKAKEIASSLNENLAGYQPDPF